VGSTSATLNSRAVVSFVTDLANHGSAARRALVNKLLHDAATVSDAASDYFVLLVGAIAASREASEFVAGFSGVRYAGYGVRRRWTPSASFRLDQMTTLSQLFVVLGV
jgi:hypothetical protein